MASNTPRSLLTSAEFRSIVERAYDCCRNNRNQSWILEPYDDFIGIFHGVIFARSNTPVPGCAFAFTLEIDESTLAELPRVHFDKPLFHPLIYTSGEFCFPSTNLVLSCRTASMEQIMEHLVNCFFLKSTVYNSSVAQNCVNREAAKQLMREEGKRKWWEQMRAQGILTFTDPKRA